jgi:hypothetical protein
VPADNIADALGRFQQLGMIPALGQAGYRSSEKELDRR